MTKIPVDGHSHARHIHLLIFFPLSLPSTPSSYPFFPVSPLLLAYGSATGAHDNNSQSQLLSPEIKKW